MNDSQVWSISPAYSKLQYLTKILHPLRPPNFSHLLRRNTFYIFGKFSAVGSLSLPNLWSWGRRVGIGITCSNRCSKLWPSLCSEEHTHLDSSTICSSWEVFLMETDSLSSRPQPFSQMALVLNSATSSVFLECMWLEGHEVMKPPLSQVSLPELSFFFWNQRHFRL